MSDVRIYVHAVWGVKNRQHVLTEIKRDQLFDHIRENATGNNINLEAINGHTDHVHSLIRLTARQSIAEVMQLIKGESAWWANKVQLFEDRLIWARSYYGRSVDEKNIYIVKRYIHNQQKHQNPLGEVKDYLESLSKKQPGERDKGQ